jgi:hypothetical protein
VKKLSLCIVIVMLCSCGISSTSTNQEKKIPKEQLAWQQIKKFNFSADEDQVSFRYSDGRWLELAWVITKPEYAKVANMYPAANGIICEGLGLLDVRGKTVSPFDKLQPVAVSDGNLIYTTNPQTSDYVLAVRTDDGTTAWQARIGENHRGEGHFFLEQGNLIFLLETPQGYRVTRFDRKSGSIIWQNLLQIDSGFSSIWAQGSGSIWILSTVQGEKLIHVMSRIDAKDGIAQTFECPFRKPFAACGNYLWYLDNERLFRFDPSKMTTTSIPAKDAISVDQMNGFVLVNSTRQPKLLVTADASIHMLFPDQVQTYGDVVFQVLQKMIVAVDPASRDELWKIDFTEQVQEIAYSPACVAVQTTDKIFIYTKR